MVNIENIKQLALSRGCDVKENEPMSRYTTFKIGGEAQLLVSVPSISVLKAILMQCDKDEVPVFILGKGSNLLVSDKGIEGVVLKLEDDFKQITLVEDDTVYCGAGVSLARLCRFALDNGLSGLEFAWGIPGSAGGAAYMNAGAYGGEMKDVLINCNHITRSGEIGSLSGEDLKLSYRHSAYTENGNIITGLSVRLKKDSKSEINRRMDEYMQRRKDKQPLEYPSAGSVFKRPEGYFAGALIQESGLKGASVGGAMVSPKHAGFIINAGGASCDDVLSLIEHIKKTVKDNTGVELECEVKPVGVF
ncbi:MULTISPECIES: UDP-N-acetylmuramate dehydrogenase [unclassified Ruminococcus]|uniref:UDP-N-acetylmuramate dehydrogenase n=1 Tax=unclassified Ruminococcus TaxID=2608920 RepID=UPI00210C05EF|nr:MULTISPECIES: UDP-N-acetylmuramate dehydrogenase [unclassified Ruminococcus]MCQ4022245.1 UDP-N-acetylmuramate dehydrogenase [Ruminococcus sp. zg-924]MCQ4114573.1 UDP-N-acetylmuramate dehydrogenase [Ruminococcus sp. zg-921]